VRTSLRDRSTAACRGANLAGTGGSKAAFFCLLFFAAAKKSRCRPAQGQRWQTDTTTRMPAQQKPKTKNQKPKTENRKPKTENRKPKTENRKPKTENRKPKKTRISD